MSEMLPFPRYPSLDCYPIFYRGVPELDYCFWAIDYDKSNYTGSDEWQLAFFSGQPLRNGDRRITFFGDKNGYIQITRSNDIASWHDFVDFHERQKQLRVIEQQQIDAQEYYDSEQQMIEQIQQQVNAIVPQSICQIPFLCLIFDDEEDEKCRAQELIETNKLKSAFTAVEPQIIDKNAHVRQTKAQEPVMAPVLPAVEDTSDVLLHGCDNRQSDPIMAPVLPTVEDTSDVLLRGTGGISSSTASSSNLSITQPGLPQKSAAGGILVLSSTPADVEPISNFHSVNSNCSSTSVVDQKLRMEDRRAKIACGKRLLHDYRASKLLQAATQVHEAGGTSISTLLGVDVTSTVIFSIGPSIGIGAAHPLCITLGEPPATAGTSAADYLAGSAYAGVDPFSAAGINAALPPRTGIGVPPTTAGLSTAESMADSASAGVYPFLATDAAYDFTADNPDNPFDSAADCYLYNASRG